MSFDSYDLVIPPEYAAELCVEVRRDGEGVDA